MTARNVQDAAKQSGLPWTIAKGFDTFLPLSNPISSASVPDPHNVDLWLSLDGEMKQEDSTGLMLFRIPKILSEISKVMTLEDGDIVLTGTPKGVGPVKAGQRMKAGMRVDGKELEGASIDVHVQDSSSSYEFK